MANHTPRPKDKSNILLVAVHPPLLFLPLVPGHVLLVWQRQNAPKFDDLLHPTAGNDPPAVAVPPGPWQCGRACSKYPIATARLNLSIWTMFNEFANLKTIINYQFANLHKIYSQIFTFKRDCCNTAQTLPTCHNKPETTRHLVQFAAEFFKIEARSTEKDPRRCSAFIMAVTVHLMTKQSI